MSNKKLGVKPNKLSSWFFFILFYALMVASMSHIMGDLPVLLQMEYAIYDPMQRWFTIDTKEDYMYSRYDQLLHDVYCINLDDSFFRPETHKVDRKKLSVLLDKLNCHSFKSVFLDFLFEPLYSDKNQSLNADSFLQKSMEPMKARLIIPYRLEFESGKICKEFSISDIKDRSTQMYRPTYTGFTAPLYLEGDDLRRYHQFRLDGGNEISAINALVESEIGKEKARELFKHIPDKFEINFVFRNEKQSSKLDALDIIEAYQILNKSFEELKKGLKNKVIFIGRFKPKIDHFDNPIDGFDTPVKSKMNGIYFLINTYLNVLENSHFKKVGFSFVFLINFILAFIGVSYFDNPKDKSRRSVFHEIKDVIIFITVFALLLVGLYVTASIKFPFVISSIIFLKLKTIKNKFELLADKFCIKWLKLSNQITTLNIFN